MAGAAKLKLARTWTYAGKRQRLVPGVYTWYVWGGGTARKPVYGKVPGSSTFSVKRQRSLERETEARELLVGVAALDGCLEVEDLDDVRVLPISSRASGQPLLRRSATRRGRRRPTVRRPNRRSRP